MKVRFFLLSSLIAIIPFVDAYAHDNYSEPVIAVPDKGLFDKHSEKHKKALKELKESCKQRGGKVDHASTIGFKGASDYWCNLDKRPLHGHGK